MKYILLFLCWVIYFALHSAFASDRAKVYFQQLLGTTFRYYRIIYSAFSMIGLMLILLLNEKIQPVLLYENTWQLYWIGVIQIAAGLMIVYLAFREHRFLSFIGLNEEINEFKQSGILKHVRHPIYSGTILIIIGFFLLQPTIASLISMLSIFVYLPIGIFLEEKKLIQVYGQSYISYRKQVPALIPKFWL